MNGHANNAMYIQWAMDAVDMDVTLSRQLTELKVNFNHEVMAGETVDLYRTVAPSSGTYYIEGKVRGAGTSSFCAELVF